VASPPAASLENLWASDVFTLDRMKVVLLGRFYKWVRSTIEKGGKLDLSVANGVANVVAEAMKTWATSRGAHYYAHVLDPLTRSTFEARGYPARDITRPAYLMETPLASPSASPPAHLRRNAVCAIRVHKAQEPIWVKTSDTGCCREGDSFSLAQRP
jgi:glutamine synthetase type III